MEIHDTLQRARATLADLKDHDDATLIAACRIIEAHGAGEERADATRTRHWLERTAA